MSFTNLTVTNLLTLGNQLKIEVSDWDDIIIYGVPGMQTGDDPVVYFSNASLWTDNDVFVCGSITSTTDFASGKQSGGGALLISHGWLGSGTQANPIVLSPPLLKLTTSGTQIKSGSSLPSTNMTDQAGQIFYRTSNNILYIWTGSSWVPSERNSSGYYDTLFLFKNDGHSPANLDLGDLIAWQLSVKSTNSVFAVTAGDNGVNQDTYLIPQNPSSGGLGLGTATYPFKWLDATNVFCNVLGKLVGTDAVGIPTGIDVGYGVSGREVNAGKICYQKWTADALDIVGAGTASSNRKIKFWAEGGATFAGDVTISKATPNIIMNATTGSPDIFFKENGTTKMSCGYWTDVDQFHVYDNVGGKAILTLNHNGQLALPVQGSNGGLSIGGDVSLYRGSVNTLYVYRNIEPGAGTETGYLGEGGRYWYGLVSKYVYYKYLYQFYDEYDDLSIAKLWGEKKPNSTRRLR